MAPGIKTGGRRKGSKNKLTAGLKDQILKAAIAAGGPDGIIGYLTTQAYKNPAPFLGLLGKVLPLTLAGDEDNPLRIEEIRRVLVAKPRDTDSGDIPAAT